MQDDERGIESAAGELSAEMLDLVAGGQGSGVDPNGKPGA